MAELSNSVERSDFCKTNGDVELDDICKRCQSIPWHEVLTDPNHISTSPWESGCRICRWFAELGCTRIFKNYSGGSFYPYPKDKRLMAACQLVDGGFGRTPWDIVVSDFKIQTALQSLTPPFISISRVKTLLNTCTEQHADCSLSKQDHVIPNLRVIDCTTRAVVNAPANCEYVALSYVWGSVQSINNDLASMQTLPRVLEQSIVVASKLGFKFLWIDRYVSQLYEASALNNLSKCIDQRNERDKNEQILQMSTIYREAQLTIIAAAGEDPTHGLPGVEPSQRSPAHGHYETVGSICLSALPFNILQGSAYFEDIRDSVWASRAWTFQEAIFSRRRLLFTESQVIFSCNTSTRCEWGTELRNDYSGLNGLQWYVVPEDNLRVTSPLRRACDILEQYSVRSMTHDSDALNAIASTLNFIQKSDEYHIWGVPFHVCYSSLYERQTAISTFSDTASRLNPSDVQMVWIYLDWRHELPQRRRQGFPSWSPLGWSPGEIYYLDTYEGCVFIDTPRGKECLSTNLRSAKADPAGMAQHISLLLKTRFVSVYKYDCSYDGDLTHSIALPLGKGFAHLIQVCWDKPVETECELKIAMISSHDEGTGFIILQAHNGYYERIGWSRLFQNTLRGWAKMGLIWCLTGDKFTPISLSAEGKLEPLDEERLRAAFGDIDDEDYEDWQDWQDGFQEELIVLG